jgi:hypothetical protein
MTTHQFTIGLCDSRDFDDLANDLFEAGCTDATLSHRHGNFLLHFAREAETLDEAFDRAISDVRKAGVVGTMLVMQGG